jgi:hypothetical protein
MYQALWLSSWAITVLFTILILWLRARSALLQSTLDKTWQEAVARGVVDTWHDDPPAAALPGAVGSKSTS